MELMKLLTAISFWVTMVNGARVLIALAIPAKAAVLE
jgi:hypothetical protein